MANGNFVVQNGLTVGGLTIDAVSGNITTAGTITTTGSGSIVSANGFGGLNPDKIYNTGSNVSVTPTTIYANINGASQLSVTSSGVTIAGNLTVQGTQTIIASTDLTISDSVINLHTAANLAPLTVDDGKDIGFKMHYYKGVDNLAFLGWANDSGSLEYYAAGAEGVGNVFTGTSYGTIKGGELVAANATSATSTTTGALRVTGGAGIAGAVYVGGNGTNAIVHTGHIVPSANLSYNIGSASAWYGTFYGVSTQAKYADLAENYQADSNYAPGTVVEFGGAEEVTLATEGTKRVAGVVSTNPAHLMNGGLTGTNVVPLALQGRVPCKVIGPVAKGDLMISAGFGYAKANNDAAVGQTIGKALADFSGAKGVIEVVVGRI